MEAQPLRPSLPTRSPARAGAILGICRLLVFAPARRAWSGVLLLQRAGLAAADHDALTLAQAVAYSAMVAMVPALVVAAALLNLLPSSLPFRAQLGVFFLRVLPSNVVPVLQGFFATTHPSETAGALLGSLVVSLFGAANVMAIFMEGFRRAHDLPLTPGSFWRRRGRALALVPLSLIPLTGASILVVFGNVLTHWVGRDMPDPLKSSFVIVALALRWTIALAGSTALVGLIYHLGTDLRLGMRTQLEPWVREPWEALQGERTWRGSLPGALLATILWFVATLGFGVYVTRFANYTRVYGSLGAAIALLAWLYIIALCILIGSEVNAQVALARLAPSRKALSFRPE